MGKPEGFSSYYQMVPDHKGVLRARPLPKTNAEDESCFWLRVGRGSENGCWLWMGVIHYNGYGQAFFNGKNHRAHRVAWVLTHGIIPPEMFVLHKCDVRACCNPNHLFVGTSADNTLDRCRKNRRTPLAKLTLEKAIEIRRLYNQGDTTLRKLGKIYGVHHKTILRTVSGEYWAELSGTD